MTTAWEEREEALEDIFVAMESGDPPPADAGLFGATIPSEWAGIRILGVPWDVTTSYGGGTSAGPLAIVQASHQLDLMDQHFGRTFLAGIEMKYLDELVPLNKTARRQAKQVIESYERGESPDPQLLEVVDEASEQANEIVYQEACDGFAEGKWVGLVGGDHSTPYGLIECLAEQYDDFGILHLDAHHDLRESYEGFTFSHASIFYNVMSAFSQVSRLVSVGIRDFSAQEKGYAESQEGRIVTYYGEDLFVRKADGQTFAQIVDEILERLPEYVYISVDIDVLSPEFAPHTGTPVPGGLSYSELIYILNRLGKSSRRVIGFDLVEVTPGDDEWDANVGARVLYKLCGVLGYSQRIVRR